MWVDRVAIYTYIYVRVYVQYRYDFVRRLSGVAATSLHVLQRLAFSSLPSPCLEVGYTVNLIRSTTYRSVYAYRSTCVS